ncbi:MAG: TIGR01212 family radical SAM protein [Clostridia bacterium]|nr:TIGR01212 family radical SAM protein [Clostridia bacterium]
MAQKDSNPFVFSDTNKRYHTSEYYLRHRFGKKVAKIPLDAGFSCPNIEDGSGGCIYCSRRGSADFVPEGITLREQYDAGRASLSSKWDTSACIAYLQAHTNTFAPPERLREVYREVLGFPALAGMNIATRADCLGDGVCGILREVSEKTVLTVELGLQSSSDATAELIRRGHGFREFTEGYRRLRELVPKAEICVHIIIGLPGETREDMMKTAGDVADLAPDQVKIHLLHVLRGTDLYDIYEKGGYVPLTREEYVTLVCDTLTRLPPRTVIARLTGDGPSDLLAAPLWSMRKTAVVNEIDKEMFRRGLFQGMLYPGEDRI